MNEHRYVNLVCTKKSFKKHPSEITRWWSVGDWAEHCRTTENALGWGNPCLPEDEWIQLYNEGYRYCASLENNRALAIAGLWPRTPDAWEVIAVAVRKGQMNKGHGKSIVSFVTEEILATVREATISTRKDNVAMIKAAQSVGFTVTGTSN